ncbi:MAG: metal-dependent hydrolase [Pseudobacteriovorax sp.]|nr:metal-dependent hydrolase [Pseudobacteriovorax sp.]
MPSQIKARKAPLTVEHKPNYKFWVRKSPLQTHMLNSVSLLLPKAEDWFCKTLRRWLPEVTDKSLQQDMRGFIYQEIQHAKGHSAHIDIMKEQGYKLDELVANSFDLGLGKISIEKHPKLALAVTAGFEHYTAILGQSILESKILDKADSELGVLFRWHAIEELEHRTVAFDALHAVDPSYGLRIWGLLLGTYCLAISFLYLFFGLMKQDQQWQWSQAKLTLRDYLRLLAHFKFFIPTMIHFFKYFGRHYHPGAMKVDSLITRNTAILNL